MKTAVDRYSATKEMQASIRGVRAMAHLYLDKKNLGATLLKVSYSRTLAPAANGSELIAELIAEL